MLHLSAISLSMLNTKTQLLTPIQVIPISEILVFISTFNWNQVLSTFENSKSDLNGALLFNTEEQNMSKRSAHTRANQVDYKKYF